LSVSLQVYLVKYGKIIYYIEWIEYIWLVQLFWKRCTSTPFRKWCTGIGWNIRSVLL